MRVHFSMSLFLLLTTALFWLSGCVSGEVEHAEHIIPTHKPEHFVEAIEQISTRLPVERNAEQQQELLDIVGWLPELAAQTDLPKSDWDQIHQWTLAWQTLGDQPDSLEKAIQENLSKLQTLSERAIELDTFNTYGQKDNQ